MALSRRPFIVALLIIAAAGALASPAVAKKKRAESFSGTCEMSGVIRHDPPLTVAPKATSFHGSFDGECSGELTDRRGRTRMLDGAPGSYDGWGIGELSCLGGVTTGTGKLRFGRGRVIGFTLTERRGPGVALVTIEGNAGGAGTVAGTVGRDEDLGEYNERCMSSGLELIRGDARIASPGISG
jgi:hypothetical protein